MMMMGHCRLLHVLQAGAAWKKASDEEKAPHVAASDREKQVYQKLSADHQASKDAAAEAETAAGSLAPPQVSMQHMHSHATDPKALCPGRCKLSQKCSPREGALKDKQGNLLSKCPTTLCRMNMWQQSKQRRHISPLQGTQASAEHMAVCLVPWQKSAQTHINCCSR